LALFKVTHDDASSRLPLSVPGVMAAAILFTTAVAMLMALVFLLYRLRVQTSQIKLKAEAEKPSHVEVSPSLSESALRVRASLQKALPGSLICPDDREAFNKLVNIHWAKQPCETAPACILRPRDTQELAAAVKILKNEFDICQRGENIEPFTAFAIRGGGHMPIVGASSIDSGVLIDMSLFDQVTPSPDGTTALIGAGCRWVQVYRTLAQRGLAVVGGRNSAVGVGGLTLGGGLSFFSPRFGLVCSNIVEYEVVLADGSVVTASANENPRLWRALKGGSNNFGIVTMFKANTFPFTKIWSGFLYLLPSQASKVLMAFHEHLDQVVSNDRGRTYDQHAAGPLACFTYLSKSGIQAIAVHLVHTEPPEDQHGWPQCWRNSRFAALWRLWSTCKVRSLVSATDELHALNLPGRRQTWGTTTVKNDSATLAATHEAYRAGVDSIRQVGVKDVSWTLVLQPLLPDWARKGQPNPLGLDASADEPLVNVQFTVNWALSADDEKVEGITRAAVERIDDFAIRNKTDHSYRYLNYCGSWQKPFLSYGANNLNFLRSVSQEYDPDGLFQRGCPGGFKLEA
jgi:FAD/FMN-containing dehydrogenase